MENRISLNEQISHAIKTYLQRRNYPAESYPQKRNYSSQFREITETQMVLNATVQNEVGKTNSIAFTCFNCDPIVIEHTFSKLVQWVNDLITKSKDHQDLNKLIPPIFCHFFIELQQKVHKDKESMEHLQKTSSNFFKFHYPTVEKVNSDETITKLLGILQGHTSDISCLKDAFRSNKYCVNLCSKSVSALKKYLSESSHVILLQIIHTWFNLNEEDTDSDDNDIDKTTMEVENEMSLLKDIATLRSVIQSNPPPIYAVHLSNVKDEVTAGVIDRRLGLASYSYNNTIFISSLVTLKQLPNTDTLGDVVIYEHSSKLYDMKIFQDVLLTASHDKTIKLFSLNDYNLYSTYKGHEYPVYCLAPTPSGSTFVSGSYDQTCRLWSYENTNTLRLYAGHTQEVTSVCFHSNSKYFVSGSADKTIRMWSIENACPVRLLLGSAGTIYASAFSDNGKMLATSGDDKAIRIWDLGKGQQICEIHIENTLINKLVWCSNDSIVCSATCNGLVQFWDVKDVWQKPEDCSMISSQDLNKKLVDLINFNDTISCLTVQSALSTTCTPSSSTN